MHAVWRSTTLGHGLLACALIILAWHPLLWLFNSWTDPSYGSDGALVFLCLSGLVFWSLSSPVVDGAAKRSQAMAGFLLAALCRLSGQLLDIQIIAALALVIDVYALAVLWRLPARLRSVSPCWLAVLFFFCLPIERLVQRVLGYGLQHVSTDGACTVLNWVTPVQCEGVRIMIHDHLVLVDLPCSGAGAVLQLSVLFIAVMAIKRPTVGNTVAGMLLVAGLGMAANSLRIALLALGIAYSPAGIDVMAQPWHDLIGYGCLTLAVCVLAWWAARLPSAQPFVQASMRIPAITVKPLPALGLIWLALLIVRLPSHPVDVATAVSPPGLPWTVGGYPRQTLQLTTQERNYFTRYGGGASRAHYGPFTLMLVKTTAPLRHMHAPDQCLAGIGHAVHRVGGRFDTVPTAVYRSTDGQGHDWRIRVSFVSEHGDYSTNVAEVIWRWFQAPGTTWTMVQRISPWQVSEPQFNAWDRAVLRALDMKVIPVQAALMRPLRS